MALAARIGRLVPLSHHRRHVVSGARPAAAVRSRSLGGAQRRRSVQAADGEGQASTSEPAPTSDDAAPVTVDDTPEEVMFDGCASNVELGVSLLLAASLLYIPLTLSSIGRRLWIKVRITNKRIQVINTSPLFGKQIDIGYKAVKEVRTAGRAFGGWGDMVIFLKNGDRLELVGVDKYEEIKQYIDRMRTML